ncbi:putative vacuolar protease A [Candida viswanathii]|uniref:Putative vacuolar protease A n=1 Tax=Candida viswanathii TaxID=5486 RepID=A0A367XP43_9ASCO|nr:putative vacuolar protease A [Candida viswanathii]
MNAVITNLLLAVSSAAAASILSLGNGAVKIDLAISDEHMYYLQGLVLGTPPQSISNIIIDSGSSDLMIVESIYNASASTTFVNTNQSYLMRYGFDDPFSVYQVSDNIESSDFTLTNLTMGYALTSDIQSFSGVLGIGFRAEELFGTNYPNFPYLLQEQGVTESVLYSFDGRDDNSAIIFGGLSTNIIDGPLVKIPFVQAILFSGPVNEWIIPAFTVNEVKLDDVIISNQNTIYQIDSGTNGFLPPTPVLNNLLTLLGTDYFEDDDGNVYYDIKDIEGRQLTFNVQGYEVGFALTDIIGETVEQNGTTYAVLNLASYNIGYDSYDAVLPNFIFKYYYGVFDYDSYQVYFGKYKQGAGAGNVVAVDNGDNLPYSTVDAPDPSNTYSVIYVAESETTIAACSTEESSTEASATSVGSASTDETTSATSDETTATSDADTSNSSVLTTPTTTSSPKRCYKA